MKHWIIAGLIAVLAIGAFACGGADEEPLSAEEYAALVCGFGFVIDMIGVPVGEFRDEYNDSVEEFFDAIPPHQYRIYHAEWYAFLQILRDYFNDIPDDIPFSWTAFASDNFVSVSTLAQAIEEAEVALSDEDTQVLIDAGCSIEREG